MTRLADQSKKPEQRARDAIDQMLAQAGWKVQSKNRIDFSAGPGVAVREYQTDIGPADYVLFVDKVPAGVIEAKPEDWGPEAHDRRGSIRRLCRRKAEMAEQQGAAPRGD